MKRIFLNDVTGEEMTISGDDAHHLAYSLRAKKGDRLTAVDGNGNSAVIELVGFDRETITARRIGEPTKINSVGDRTFKKYIMLADCLPKQNKFDLIVEKATELGVDEIIPLISDRTIARPGHLREAAKLARWERIAKSAAEQCARDVLPKINKISEISDWLQEISPRIMKFGRDADATQGKKSGDADTLLLFCNETEREQSLHDFMQEYKAADCDKKIIVLIGPEGSFSEREVRDIRACGGVSVSLGPQILKTDTAAISALAIVRYELQTI